MGQLVNPVTLEKGLRAEFVKALAAAENTTDYLPALLQVSSTSVSENYGWLGDVPELTEWKDERKLKGILDYNYQIKNKDYEATLQVDKNTIEDDQLGTVKPRIAELAVRAKQHPRKLFLEALVKGSTELAYDGQTFFSTSHVMGMSGTMSNILTGTGVGFDQISADLDSAIMMMSLYKDDQGAPFAEDIDDSGIMIIAPSQLRPVMNRVFNSQTLANGATNPQFGRIASARIIYSSRLTDVNDWYILNVSQGMKPFIQQNRQAARFGALEATSDRGFMSKRYLYGVDYRIGFGYGLWQHAIKIVNA